ncbi:unnamed protein product [Haemonchus placei]|uniref:Uncharacterized protein n=1 Tax=Haemonchus placei TaxID=6290 RepID=A0A158QRM5_HAEPC|nr:unnamed protein product [Haemonchus placei]
MIGLVWSLVSSVVETARRRRLAAFLADFLAHVSNDGLMLVCRHIPSVTSASSSNGLSRYSSDPQISTVSNNRSVLYRNERTEVVTEKAEPLKTSQWRFAKGSVVPPTAADSTVFFIAQRTSANESNPTARLTAFDAVPYCSIFLDSSCERIGWHRFANATLYSCPLERFVDVVYAFSEGALFDNITDARLVDSVNTVSIPYSEISDSIIRADSPLAQSLTNLNQRPLTLLEQLYRGDSRPWPQQFISETALHVIGQRPFDSIPRQYYKELQFFRYACRVPAEPLHYLFKSSLGQLHMAEIPGYVWALRATRSDRFPNRAGKLTRERLRPTVTISGPDSNQWWIGLEISVIMRNAPLNA